MASVVIRSRRVSLYISPNVLGILFKTLLPALAIVFLVPANVLSHDVAESLDPELLTGWRTWLHLSIQWTHLVAFALWFGLTAGTLLLGIKPRLDQLLYSSWILFLVMLATGSYNMEYSAGIPETPSLFLLPLLERIPYGVTYTLVLAVKLGLYVLSILITLLVTLLHVGRRVAENKLLRSFIVSQASLAVAIALATAMVLFYHEVADLWPTAIHSLSGVVAPEGPRGQAMMNPNLPPPNDFRLLATGAAWIDISVRLVHLLGFGLLLGGSAVALVFGPVSAARFLLISWVALLLQIASGVASMNRWTPFYLPPYFWNLHDLSHIRFGRSYTLFMAAKHVLVLATVVLMIFWTFRYLRLCRQNRSVELPIHFLTGASFFLGLVIGYIIIIILFLHEGVDHAL